MESQTITISKQDIPDLINICDSKVKKISEIFDNLLTIEQDEENTEKLIIPAIDILKDCENDFKRFKLNIYDNFLLKLNELFLKVKEINAVADSDTVDCMLKGFEHLQKLYNEIGKFLKTIDDDNDEINCQIEDNAELQDTFEWIDIELGKLIKNNIETDVNENIPVENNENLDFSKHDFELPQHMVEDFVGEGYDYIKSIEDSLLQAETDPYAQSESLDTILRSFHSIKGNAGLLISVIKNEIIRERHIVNKIRVIAHSSETLVQLRRDNNTNLTGDEIDLLLKILDSIKSMFETFYDGEFEGKDITELVNACNLASGVDISDRQDKTEEKTVNQKVISQEIDPKNAALLNTFVQIKESMSAGLVEIDNQEIRHKSLKKIKRAIKTLISSSKAANLDEIINISNDGLIKINNLITDYNDTLKQESLPFFQSIIDSIDIIINEKSKLKKSSHKKTRYKKVDAGKDQITKKTNYETATVKVPQLKLDHLMNLIGELIVGKNSLLYLARSIIIDESRPDIGSKVKDAGSMIGRISEELQSSIMDIRMTPLSHIFTKFPRLVRDLSREMDKKVNLKIIGAETELDKTVIENIGTPIVHLIRNAVDHGIETTEERELTKKSKTAEIILKAYNEGNYVIIEINDDGRGIDIGKIGAIAVKRGILDMDTLEKLNDEEIKNLIFQPGFSSAKEITNISGRGVGMDVVKREVEAINGTINVTSELGKGTNVSMRLPLTLAVSKGLKVSIQGEYYYMPLEYISETVKINKSLFHEHHGEKLVLIRNEILVVKDLGKIIGLYDSMDSENNDICSLVILDFITHKVAVLVDHFFREEEYVIKKISGDLANISEFVGATITSDGKVILVINPLIF